ncbi:MAG: hypothetical protein GX640_12995 [Fibrobacter sp.]|nr:hypothetical protein [Fibrobacter sp.]
MSEVRVMEAKAQAIEKEGSARAKVLELTASAEAKGIEMKSVAEARGVEAKSEAIEKQGTAEASVMEKKYIAEAKGIKEKADSMKLLDGVGKEHEEFKLRLEKEKSVELAQIEIQKDIADAQAQVIQEALRSAKIDIVGGETLFFDKIMGSITAGKAVDRMVNNSDVLGDIRSTFFNGDPDYFKNQLKKFISQFSMSSEDVKNLTVSALIGRMLSQAEGSSKDTLNNLLGLAEKFGVGGKSVHKYLS